MSSQTVHWQGRDVLHRWMPGAEMPAGLEVRQVSGVCFVPGGQILLVSRDGQDWALPGGHPEPGETPERTLRREVREEAETEIWSCGLIGAQLVEDPSEPPYLQLSYAAHVRLDPFVPRSKTRFRQTLPLEQAQTALGWGRAIIGQALMGAARRWVALP